MLFLSHIVFVSILYAKLLGNLEKNKDEFNYSMLSKYCTYDEWLSSEMSGLVKRVEWLSREIDGYKLRKWWLS